MLAELRESECKKVKIFKKKGNNKSEEERKTQIKWKREGREEGRQVD